MTFSTFEYSLAFISIILIITIVVIIFYKKTEDDENEVDDVNDVNDVNDANDTTISKNKLYGNGFDTIENFYAIPYSQSNIDSILTNNSKISELITSINNISSNNPSVNMKYDTIDIDNKLQNNISDTLNSNTNALLSTLDTSNVRINGKISTLMNQITDLENIINKLHLKSIIKPNYSKIKSLNNGAEITLTQTPNTSFVEPRSGINTGAYMVNLNNGCLSVGATDYDVYKCNDKNSKHLFKMEHIINETAYQNNIDKSMPINNIDISTVNYPFVLMKSINNKNCLTNQNGNITVQPCDTLTAQRWLPE